MQDFKGEKGTQFFHSSFSGDVLIIIPEKKTDEENEFEVPFEDLKEFIAESIRCEKINRLEDAEPDELFGL